jgi:hypothetical protein
MNRRHTFASIALLIALLSASEASAWTKVKNNWTHPIHIAYIYASIHGFGCGYTTCNDHWRQIGWYNVNPGGTATVNSHPHHNATHWFFAFDDFGSWWGSDVGCLSAIFPGPYDYCSNTSCGTDTPGTREPAFNDGTNECCGFNCSPVDRTVTFDP